MSPRNLTLFRHASAVSAGPAGDFNRPLKKKGIEKTRQNSEFLCEKGYSPDLVISSPALRALQTAEIFSETIEPQYPVDDILKFKSLYMPSIEDILEILKQLNSDYSDVFLFSHNNGISFFAQYLSGNHAILMPAGAAVRIEVDLVSWAEIRQGSGRLVDFLP